MCMARHGTRNKFREPYSGSSTLNDDLIKFHALR